MNLQVTLNPKDTNQLNCSYYNIPYMAKFLREKGFWFFKDLPTKVKTLHKFQRWRKLLKVMGATSSDFLLQKLNSYGEFQGAMVPLLTPPM